MRCNLPPALLAELPHPPPPPIWYSVIGFVATAVPQNGRAALPVLLSAYFFPPPWHGVIGFVAIAVPQLPQHCEGCFASPSVSFISSLQVSRTVHPKESSKMDVTHCPVFVASFLYLMAYAVWLSLEAVQQRAYLTDSIYIFKVNIETLLIYVQTVQYWVWNIAVTV